MADHAHPTDVLQEALDGRLDAAALAELDLHLAACDSCRNERDALKWAQTEVRATVASVEVPPDFEARLKRLLDAEDAGRAPAGTSAQHRSPKTDGGRTARWFWAAAAIAAVLSLVLGPRIFAPALPEQVGSTFRAYRAGELALDVRSRDVAQIEAFFERTDRTLAVRVYDLGMMRYEAQGGALTRLGDRPTTLVAYRGPAGETLLCEMYRGKAADLPPGARRVAHDGIDFLTYTTGALTVVFWQEGELVCVLAAEGDPRSLLDLAFAKALKV